MCGVDLGDVFAGRRSARWALGFLPRLGVHPESVSRALIRGGESNWEEWFGWSQVAMRVLQQTNYFLAAHGVKRPLPGPESVKAQPKTLEEAFAQIAG